MAPKAPRRAQVPPLLEVDEAGLRYHRDGPVLRIERRPRLLALVWPTLLTVGTGLVAFLVLRDGNWLMGGVLAVATIFPAAFLWMRLVHRVHLALGPDGLSWNQTKPAALEGSWPARSLGGVRIVYGPEPAAWGHHRTIRIEVERNGTWTPLASGQRANKAEAFAEAVALTLGRPLGRIDEDQEPGGRAPETSTPRSSSEQP